VEYTEILPKDLLSRASAEEFARVLRTGKCGVCEAQLEATIRDPTRIEFNSQLIDPSFEGESEIDPAQNANLPEKVFCCENLQVGAGRSQGLRSNKLTPYPLSA
jgi:hypothetical protein